MDHNIQSLFSVAEVDLIYRNKVSPGNRIKITGSDSVYDVFISAWDLNKIDMIEQFYLMMLDRANHCIGLSNISTGGISACVVDPKIVFATALKANSSSIVVAHNHPSGNLKPSNADIRLTEKLKHAGQFLDLPVMDHLIVTPLKYYSFANEGLIL